MEKTISFLKTLAYILGTTFFFLAAVYVLNIFIEFDLGFNLPLLIYFILFAGLNIYFVYLVTSNSEAQIYARASIYALFIYLVFAFVFLLNIPNDSDFYYLKYIIASVTSLIILIVFKTKANWIMGLCVALACLIGNGLHCSAEYPVSYIDAADPSVIKGNTSRDFNYLLNVPLYVFLLPWLIVGGFRTIFSFFRKERLE